MLDRLNNMSNATYGMEIEASHMRRDTDISGDGTWCLEEGSIIHRETGLGNDPKGEYNLLGGEIQVQYAFSEDELFNRVIKLLDKTNCPTINMPSTMHIHIRIPELLLDENLDILKKLVNYTTKWWTKLMPIISQLADMNIIEENFKYDTEHLKMMKRAYRDKYRTRWGIYTEHQINRMMCQTTFKEFINNIAAPHPKTGNPMWFCTPRPGANFSKLRSNMEETIEFRCFSATSDPEEIRNIIEFPRKYITCALLDLDPTKEFEGIKYPKYYSWDNWEKEQCDNWINTDADKRERSHIINYLKEKLMNESIFLYQLGYPKLFWSKELGEEEYNRLEKISLDKQG